MRGHRRQICGDAAFGRYVRRKHVRKGGVQNAFARHRRRDRERKTQTRSGGYDRLGRSSQPDHFRELCRARLLRALPRRVRRLFDDGGESCGGGGVRQRGVLPQRRRGDGKPLRFRRTAVPLSARTRHDPPAAVAVDGHGRGRVARRGGGRGDPHHLGNAWEGGGFRRDGREQHGRGNGACGGGYHSDALPYDGRRA